jgi:hypothetical protein
LKNKRNKSIFHPLKALSLSMAMLFLFLTTIQALHQHFIAIQKEDVSNGQEYLKVSDTCAVCDYLNHQHNKEFHLPAPVLVTAPIAKPVTLLSRSYAGIYKFTLQGFTNKGPPRNLV